MSGKYLKLSDNDLLGRIKKNEQEALKELFDRYYVNLCRFSFQFLFLKELSEEAVSDVFLNIWLRRGQIEITNSVKAYLYRSVKNQSLNYLKANKPAHYCIESIEFEKAWIPETSNILNVIELEEEIENLLEQIPEKRQLVFKMSRLHGLKYKEISEILSISVNTVQNHIVGAVKFILKYRNKY